eukprot:GHVR01119798.1.p1 GENE.GHVR01119798.1~~GHVR01119798.1.p1  ORF type:complete len:359 (+),score=52.42 GHVR01119798.1:255-1331(+)
MQLEGLIASNDTTINNIAKLTSLENSLDDIEKTAEIIKTNFYLDHYTERDPIVKFKSALFYKDVDEEIIKSVNILLKDFDTKSKFESIKVDQKNNQEAVNNFVRLNCGAEKIITIPNINEISFNGALLNTVYVNGYLNNVESDNIPATCTNTRGDKKECTMMQMHPAVYDAHTNGGYQVVCMPFSNGFGETRNLNGYNLMAVRKINNKDTDYSPDVLNEIMDLLNHECGGAHITTSKGNPPPPLDLKIQFPKMQLFSELSLKGFMEENGIGELFKQDSSNDTMYLSDVIQFSVLNIYGKKRSDENEYSDIEQGSPNEWTFNGPFGFALKSKKGNKGNLLTGFMRDISEAQRTSNETAS